ncbi:hypothetical protein NA57DRAFT_57759 [Rhizodiscina lignyota]|uniref:Uncharacterized protein n=1 Tax=Rhizodiscina lignyota TaxID=1504668 RepID=A0A9P4IDR9_9PEZI|nr:hypothetical protein NA57DRAFT_57759 [Rhizodiscina lignyota]
MSLPSRSALLGRSSVVSLPIRTFSTTSRRFASGDYGSGKGDPKGEKPQEQGPNPSADKEHPGPPPPKAGQGTGGGPTKKGEAGHQGSEGQKKSFSTYSRPLEQRRGFKSSPMLSATGLKKPKGDTENAQPKILGDNPPAEGEQSEEVKQHNKEVDERAERPTERVDEADVEKDKVHKKFWAGQGGRDKDP